MIHGSYSSIIAHFRPKSFKNMTTAMTIRQIVSNSNQITCREVQRENAEALKAQLTRGFTSDC